MARDMYYKDIDRLADLDASHLPIIFSKHNLNNVFDDEPSVLSVSARLKKKLKYGLRSLQDATEFRNASGFIRKRHYYLIEREIVYEDGSPKLHLVNECPGTYYLGYPLPKNSYLLEKLDLLIGRLDQAVITSFIGISPVWTWIVNDRRHEGYDLEKGPVFYEAYYPENNEHSPSEYQEKRYFDRDAVLERTFQIPADRKEYIEEQSKNEYPERLERIRYNGGYVSDPKFSMEPNYAKMEASRPYEIARRPYEVDRLLPVYVERSRSTPGDSSLSRDFENWNSLENYLHFDPNLDRRRGFVKSDIDGSNFRAIPERDLVQLRSSIFEKRNDNGEAESLREIRKNLSAASPRAIQPLELPKDLESMRRLSPRDVQDRNPFESVDSINYPSYPRQQYRYFGNTNDREPLKWMSDVRSLPNQRMEAVPRAIDSLPSENIFAPRPQVINYVFSKGSSIESTEKPVTMTVVPKNEEPRKYGDNLLQEELKKVEEEKDTSAKVTSIEISEVPKHKIRHHHGEWLRDFSRGPK
ncbi:hypothetical protein KPH14_009435 [Odynerus spinipes]|uniref:Uncharacterized protein n=1 Tax=Odynerus spinipes TaxID=1348599 RepID=A0AAD9RPK8_9HYME|nr:hypothetical protein KPH14_009435 [Odynerus spinipes]